MTLLRLEAVIQTNMFMPWAVSFQNSIKAASEVGDFNGSCSLMQHLYISRDVVTL